MPETVIDKEVCPKCGAAVRENTQFCYNCGAPVGLADQNGTASDEDPEEARKAAIAELEARFKIDEPTPESEDKLAKAAEERKKARVERRKPKEYRWEPAATVSLGQLMLLSVLVALIVFGLVLFTVWIR